jgi:hypothetical protein
LRLSDHTNEAYKPSPRQKANLRFAHPIPPYNPHRMAKHKEVTREQAALKKSQAAAFMERIGQPDRAEEFESISVDEYA